MFSTSNLPRLFLTLLFWLLHTISLSAFLFRALCHSVFPLAVFFLFLRVKFPVLFFQNSGTGSIWLFVVGFYFLSYLFVFLLTNKNTYCIHKPTCVAESEKASVPFAGQLDLIFSTFCFHTLPDSPRAETQRGNRYLHVEWNRDIAVWTMHTEIS